MHWVPTRFATVEQLRENFIAAHWTEAMDVVFNINQARNNLIIRRDKFRYEEKK